MLHWKCLPDPWKPHARDMDPLLPARMGARDSKAFVTGSIPAASARACSELLHPHPPEQLLTFAQGL